ncbi:MAG: DUF5024 domain-containing protein [Duncaniella sp.]|nr:DUF5024 domain-containing protein [Duncaniella sp.]
MTRHLRRLVLSATLVMFSTLAAFAQSSIEKIVTKLEDNPKCETTTYRETRDPKTHKITSFEMTVTFKDNAIAERIISAFKNERKNAISYSANNYSNSRTNKLYMIVFNNNGSYSKYTLSYTKGKRKTTKTTSKGTTVSSEDLWTLLVKSSEGYNGDNTRKQHKKTSVKRSRTTGQNKSYAVVPESFDIDIDVDIDPDFLVDIIQSSIDIPTSLDFRY